MVLGNQEVEPVLELKGKSRPAGHPTIPAEAHLRWDGTRPDVMGRTPERQPHTPPRAITCAQPLSIVSTWTLRIFPTTCGLGCSAFHASCLPSLPEPHLANQPIRCPSDWQTGHPRLTSLGISSWSNKPPAPPLCRSQQVIRYLAHVLPREPTVLHSSFERQHLRKPLNRT